MTCVIGLEQGGDVYIGADSAAASGWEVRASRMPKVFRRGPFLIGYTSSFRMGQLLQYHLTVAPQDGEDDGAYMVCTFIEAVRECLKSHGYTKVENNQEEAGQFLVGYNGRLYFVDEDLQVNRFIDDFDAVGCGREYALGAMKALPETLGPEERIERSLEIAAHFSGGVCEPFKVMKL